MKWFLVYNINIICVEQNYYSYKSRCVWFSLSINAPHFGFYSYFAQTKLSKSCANECKANIIKLIMFSILMCSNFSVTWFTKFRADTVHFSGIYILCCVHACCLCVYILAYALQIAQYICFDYYAWMWALARSVLCRMYEMVFIASKSCRPDVNPL